MSGGAWAEFVMGWEHPPSWRFLKRRRWIKQHRTIYGLEFDLGLHSYKIGGSPRGLGWLWT
jgi:hypothetical protein